MMKTNKSKVAESTLVKTIKKIIRLKYKYHKQNRKRKNKMKIMSSKQMIKQKMEKQKNQ